MKEIRRIGREEHAAACGKDEKTAQKAESSMPRHARCGDEYSAAYEEACLGMRSEDEVVELNMPQHTKEHAAA
ncbi:hypothetical protein MRB53_035093 [Persea americana]|uniref:Uncharacterized protein n=1 Tax=Persea americana TaxID=3435 RepID=A0ACC2K3Q7_PERAE|nr:hypothetical protein MRB53_035093 [Persea americana]